MCEYHAKYGDDKVNDRQSRALEVIWADEVVSKILKERGLEEDNTDLGDTLDAIVRALGLPRTLKEVGIGKNKSEEFAGLALQDKFWETNTVPLKRMEQVIEILETVLE